MKNHVNERCVNERMAWAVDHRSASEMLAGVYVPAAIERRLRGELRPLAVRPMSASATRGAQDLQFPKQGSGMPVLSRNVDVTATTVRPVSPTTGSRAFEPTG